MSKKNNSLYTGKELMTEEGRSIKHIGLILGFNTPNIDSKTSDTPISFVGGDIETNHLTSELKLLGLWNGESYFKYTDNFLSNLYGLLKYCDFENKALVFWNKLDPFILFKQFLKVLSPEARKRAMKRWGKVGGEWSQRDNSWRVSPLVEVRINESNISFGIVKVIRSSVQFFIRKDGEPLNRIWAYDIAPLYKEGLESVMKQYKNKYPYYSKIDKSAHLVDWERYENDQDYRINIVEKSNMFDARAAYDLANNIQEQFKTAFGYYSRSLISTGSLARAAVVATLKNKYIAMGLKPKEVREKALADLTSISIKEHIKEWSKQVDQETLKSFVCLTTEAYSAGYIEAINYGYIGNAFYADLAGAYHKHIKELLDLRGSTLTSGTGEPPRIKNSYCLIRGTVDIPEQVNFHPITVKHFENKDTNVRGVGKYRASYTLGERDDLIELGAVFMDEEWFNVETLGERAAIAETIDTFIDLREKLDANNDPAAYMTKITSSSIYGIIFEANEEYIENNNNEVERIGYNGGEFFNSLHACIITSEVRRQQAKAANAIFKAGGVVHLLMTDSIFWSGRPDMIPAEMQRDIKTTGYYEKTEPIYNFVLLGTGRYTYTDKEGHKVTTKNRGLNIREIHDPNGADLTTYNWNEALKIAAIKDQMKIIVKTRTLISVGQLANNNVINTLDDDGNEIEIPLDYTMLGLVFEGYRKVDIIAGLSKRVIDEYISSPKQLINNYVTTHSLYFEKNMFQDNQIYDQTLPKLREAVMLQDYFAQEKRTKVNRSKASMTYAEKNKDEINATLKQKYQRIKDLGFTPAEAKRMRKWSWEKINDTIINKEETK